MADEKIVHEEISHMLPLVMNWVRNQMAMAKITIDRLAEDVSRLRDQIVLSLPERSGLQGELKLYPCSCIRHQSYSFKVLLNIYIHV